MEVAQEDGTRFGKGEKVKCSFLARVYVGNVAMVMKTKILTYYYLAKDMNWQCPFQLLLCHLANVYARDLGRVVQFSSTKRRMENGKGIWRSAVEEMVAEELSLWSGAR
jgi:hypothetical protein